MIADGAQFETESSPLVASQGQGWIRQTHRSGSAPPPSHVARRKRGCRRRVVVAFGLTLGSWKRKEIAKEGERREKSREGKGKQS